MTFYALISYACPLFHFLSLYLLASLLRPSWVEIRVLLLGFQYPRHLQVVGSLVFVSLTLPGCNGVFSFMGAFTFSFLHRVSYTHEVFRRL